MDKKHFVGIDLGTTNSALASIDAEQAGDAESPPIAIVPIPQHFGPGRVETFPTLPSFLFLGEETYVGTYAREQGALVPAKLIHSAKSWLSNPEVDRREKILPWDAPPAVRVFSPVEASAAYLRQIKLGWEQATEAPLAAQEVVLTVPASFDEEARELTVEAATAAGFENITLLEEPAAAFYAWIARHLAQSARQLFDGMTVLVCDVGGGTSDFTLVRVGRKGDAIEFTRTAVGKHLLLGGDNLDLTLAWLVESKLGRQLALRQRSGLRRQCASAKERLLSEETLAAVEITVLGAGSSLVGGTMKASIQREEALELTLEGFLPFCEIGDKPQNDPDSLYRESGLPYVSDPAITRHLAAFLTSAKSPAPDAILFNGGFFIPPICRRRVAEVVERWYGRKPMVMEGQKLDLAVAIGAAYYARARSAGTGVLVRGGLPRTYFLGIGVGDPIRAVCLVPRGTEEGASLELRRDDLRLVANKPVSFRLFSALQRKGDALGDVVEFPANDEDLYRHAPLEAVIRFGRKTEEQHIPVALVARLTEVGTLDLWAQSHTSDHRWRLEFDLRKKTVDSDAAAKPVRPAVVVAGEGVGRAEELLRQVFGGGEESEIAPEQLPARLDDAAGVSRGSWPLDTLRRLGDTLLDLVEGRKRGPAFELRWLNLCGFCLRPGFGFPGDDLRVENSRRLFGQGVQFARQVQCEIEWWIFWGRLAGGLNKAQQSEIYQQLSPYLLPRGGKQLRLNSSLLREMWRTAASLELLPAGTRTELGETLAARIRKGDFRESELWCLARLGARRLFYGPNNLVLPPATVARWVHALVKIPQAAETLAMLAQRTGDLARDLPSSTVEVVRSAIAARTDAAKLLPLLEGKAERDLHALGRIYGEDLPSGLVFASQDAEHRDRPS